MDDEEFKRYTKELIKRRMPDIPDEQIDSHHDSSMYWGPENLALAAEWVSKTLLILADGRKFTNQEVFINFFGVLDDSELFSFLKSKNMTFKLLGIPEDDIPAFIESNKDPQMRRFFEQLWQALKIVELIRRDFSDDEKFLLRFVRHRHCHITLSNFAARIEGQGLEAQFKTANWERLNQLAQQTDVSKLRKLFGDKLKIHKANLAAVASLIRSFPDQRILPE